MNRSALGVPSSPLYGASQLTSWERYLFFWRPAFLMTVDRRVALVDIGLVCRSWRDASLSTHRLWSGVQIDMPTIGLAAFDRIISWFGRSGALPKILALHSNHSDCRCPEEPKACHSSKPVLRRLLTEGPVYHHLTLWCRDVDCLRNWITATQFTRLKSISSLQLIFAEVAWTDGTDASQSVFMHLPPITSLSLELPSVSCAFEQEDDSVPVELHTPPHTLRGLKSLTILCDWSGTQVIDLMRECTHLETLEVGWAAEQRPPPMEHLLLDNLLTLRVRNADQADILRHIRAPRLQNLDIELFDAEAEAEDQPGTPSQGLDDFIAASSLGGVLQSLRMSGITSTGEQLAFALNRLWGAFVASRSIASRYHQTRRSFGTASGRAGAVPTCEIWTCSSYQMYTLSKRLSIHSAVFRRVFFAKSRSRTRRMGGRLGGPNATSRHRIVGRVVRISEWSRLCPLKRSSC